MSTQDDPYAAPGQASDPAAPPPQPAAPSGPTACAQPQPAYAQPQPTYAYPTPGYGGASGSGRGLAVAALVVAVLALVAAGVALVVVLLALFPGDPGPYGPYDEAITGTLAQAEAGQPYAGADLADEVARAFDTYYGPDSIIGTTCPDLPSVSEGESVTCTATVLDEPSDLEVVLTDDRGHFEVLESPS